MAKSTKAPQSFREEAQIIINLRGNENQICVRYTSMAEAKRQYNELDKACRKTAMYKDDDRAVVTLNGSALTFVGVCASIEAWSLVSTDAMKALMAASMPGAA